MLRKKNELPPDQQLCKAAVEGSLDKALIAIQAGADLNAISKKEVYKEELTSWNLAKFHNHHILADQLEQLGAIVPETFGEMRELEGLINEEIVVPNPLSPAPTIWRTKIKEHMVSLPKDKIANMVVRPECFNVLCEEEEVPQDFKQFGEDCKMFWKVANELAEQNQTLKNKGVAAYYISDPLQTHGINRDTSIDFNLDNINFDLLKYIDYYYSLNANPGRILGIVIYDMVSRNIDTPRYNAGYANWIKDDPIKKSRSYVDLAIMLEDLEILEQLVEAKADFNMKNVVGIAPIHLAAKQKNKSVLKLLLAGKANFDLPNTEKKTPYQMLVDDPGFRHLILSHYTALESLNPAWLISLRTTDPELFRYYLLKLVYRNLVAEDKKDSILHYAVKNDFNEIIAMCYDANINFEHCNALQETPLQLAIRSNKQELAILLFIHGATATQQDKQKLINLKVDIPDCLQKASLLSAKKTERLRRGQVLLQEQIPKILRGLLETRNNHVDLVVELARNLNICFSSKYLRDSERNLGIDLTQAFPAIESATPLLPRIENIEQAKNINILEQNDDIKNARINKLEELVHTQNKSITKITEENTAFSKSILDIHSSYLTLFEQMHTDMAEFKKNTLEQFKSQAAQISELKSRLNNSENVETEIPEGKNTSRRLRFLSF